MNNYQNFLDKLVWRYATKKFDPEKLLSTDQVNLIEESLRLSPSSYGVQPWKFYRVENQEMRAKIKDAAYGQSQVTEASHLFILASRVNFGVEDVSAYIKDVAVTRGVEESKLDGYKDMILGVIKSKTPGQVDDWSARQLYIALGFGLMAAAENDIDACPMEGFDTGKVDDILGIKEDGYASRVMLTVGFRSSDDQSASLKKVRFAAEEAIKNIL